MQRVLPEIWNFVLFIIVFLVFDTVPRTYKMFNTYLLSDKKTTCSAWHVADTEKVVVP